jgi:membrane-associated protease RseP (regulator of RpoE activity)
MQHEIDEGAASRFLGCHIVWQGRAVGTGERSLQELPGTPLSAVPDNRARHWNNQVDPNMSEGPMAALTLTLRRNLNIAAAIGAALIVADGARSQVTEPLGTSRTETSTTTEQRFTLNLGWELADTDDGVRVEKIEENSPAAKSHIEEGDIIIKLNEENVRTAERLAAVLNEVDRDDELEIVVRRDGKELSYILPLKEVSVVENTETTRSEQNVTQLLMQIQQQLRQQQATLDALLAEMRSMRGQDVSGQDVNVNADVGRTRREFTGDIVAPLGTGFPAQDVPAGQNTPGNPVTPLNNNTPGSPAP